MILNPLRIRELYQHHWQRQDFTDFADQECWLRSRAHDIERHHFMDRECWPYRSAWFHQWGGIERCRFHLHYCQRLKLYKPKLYAKAEWRC